MKKSIDQMAKLYLGIKKPAKLSKSEREKIYKKSEKLLLMDEKSKKQAQDSVRSIYETMRKYSKVIKKSDSKLSTSSKEKK